MCRSWDLKVPGGWGLITLGYNSGIPWRKIAAIPWSLEHKCLFIQMSASHGSNDCAERYLRLELEMTLWRIHGWTILRWPLTPITELLRSTSLQCRQRTLKHTFELFGKVMITHQPKFTPIRLRSEFSLQHSTTDRICTMMLLLLLCWIPSSHAFFQSILLSIKAWVWSLWRLGLASRKLPKTTKFSSSTCGAWCIMVTVHMTEFLIVLFIRDSKAMVGTYRTWVECDGTCSWQQSLFRWDTDVCPSKGDMSSYTGSFKVIDVSSEEVRMRVTHNIPPTANQYTQRS